MRDSRVNITITILLLIIIMCTCSVYLFRFEYDRVRRSRNMVGTYIYVDGDSIMIEEYLHFSKSFRLTDGTFVPAK